LLKNIVNLKKVYVFEYNNIFIYIEGNNIVVAGYLGISKLKLSTVIVLSNLYNKLHFKVKYNSLLHRPIKNYNYIYYCVQNLFNIFKNTTIGFTIKYKIIGLGHKILYSKNIYLLKLGYSHLVFCFIPFIFSSKKKKKKKKFNKIVSLESIKLNNFFFLINKLRVPDIFSMNGIFNRIYYIQFKAGKKSFLL